MKNNKKLTLLSSLAALIAVAGVGTIGANAEGTVKPEALTTFAMQHATSVRTTAPYGIRFTATLSEAEYTVIQNYAAENEAPVEYGMLIIPTDLIPAGETLDCDDDNGTLKESGTQDVWGDLGEDDGDPTNDVIVTPDTNPKDNYEKIVAEPIYDETTGTYSITGGIKGVLPNNFSRPFTARAYVMVAGTYYYTQTWERSIYTAATYAESNLTAGTEEHTYFTETVIGAVEGTYTEAETVIESGADEYDYDFDYGMIQVGQTFSVKGYVTRTITDNNGTPDDTTDDTTITRKLESKATLTNATNVKYLSGGTYKVTAIGEIDVTADVGAVASVTNKQYKARQSVYEINEANHDKLGAAYSGTFNTKLVEYAGETCYWIDVKEDYGTEDTSDDKAMAQGFAMPKGALPVKAGQTLLIDMYAPKPATSYVYPVFRFLRPKVKGGSGYVFGRCKDSEYAMGNGNHGAGIALFDDVLYNAAKTNDEIFSFQWYNPTTGEPFTGAGFHNIGYNKWQTLAITFNIDIQPDDQIQIFAYGGYNDLYVANIRIVDADYVFAMRTVTDFAMVEEAKGEYAEGEMVNFNVSYTDNFGRNLVANASEFGTFTVKGTHKAPTVANGAVTFGEYGDVTAQYTYGDYTSETVSLIGPVYARDIDITTIKGGYAQGKVADYSVYTHLDSWMGNDDVMRMYVPHGRTKDGVVQSTIGGFNFGDKTVKCTKGTYLTLDVFVPHQGYIVTPLPGGDTYMNSSGVAGKYQYYNADGTKHTGTTWNATTDQPGWGEWLRLEIYNNYAELGVGYYAHIMLYANTYSARTLYIGRAVVSNRSLKNLNTGLVPEIELEEVTKPAQLELLNDNDPLGVYLNNWNNNNKYTDNLVKTTEDIENVANAGEAYEWTCTSVKDVAGALTSQSKLDSIWGGLNFTTTVRRLYDSYSYFYFDIYLTEAGEQVAFRSGGITTVMYQTPGVYAESYNNQVKFFNPETGEEITEGNLSTLNGQWVRVRMHVDLVHNYHGLLFAKLPTGRIFMRNIWMSKTANLYTKADGATKY